MYPQRREPPLHNPKECPKCHGTGKITPKPAWPGDQSGSFFTKKCDICGGRGYVSGGR